MTISSELVCTNRW